MAKVSGMFFWVGLLVCCAVAAFGQADDLDQTIGEYNAAFTLGGPLIWTLLWSLAYLPIYLGALVIPMHYMQRFTGFDASLTCWIAVLWLGGLGANYAGYGIVNHFGDASQGGGRWLAVLIAAVLIFGWCVALAQLPWADLSFKESLLIAGIVAVLCAPYFGNTWRFDTAKPVEEESRVSRYQIARTVEGSEGWKHDFVSEKWR